MKFYKAALAILFVIIIVLLYGLRQQSQKLEALGGDISNSFYKKLRATGEGNTSVFHRSDNPPDTIETYEVEIDLKNFIEVLTKLKEDEGILFQPILLDPDATTIHYMMVVCNASTGQRRDDKMYLLTQDLTKYGDLNDAEVSYDNTYFDNYVKNINNVEYKDSLGLKKPSRFYSRQELIEMLARRDILVFDDDLNQYDSWRLYIKGAAILADHLNDLETYYSSQKPQGYDWSYHIGFTTILRVKSPLQFKGAAYEIGNPCPPRCLN